MATEKLDDLQHKGMMTCNQPIALLNRFSLQGNRLLSVIRLNGLRRAAFFLLLPLAAPLSLLAPPDGKLPAGTFSVPIYPPDGKVEGRYPPNQFVFFDYKSSDLVVTYRTAPDAPRKVHRIKIPAPIAPRIESTVSKAPQGGYRYRYVVTNEPRAAQPIPLWLLSVPYPPPWNPAKASYQALHDEGEPGAWNQGLYAHRPGIWSIRFSSLRSGSPLLPGQSAVFVVQSEIRPGISEANFHGVVTSVETLPDGVPPKVRQQLEQVIRNQGWGSEIRWTIGPQYNPTVSSQEIATDYHSRLTSLVNHGILDRNSPFVRTVLARLEAFIKKPRYWDGWDACCGYSLPVDEPFPPIGVPPDPRSLAEQKIDRALELALVNRPLSDQRTSDPRYRAPDPQFRETAVIPFFREERSSIVLFQTVYKKDLDGTHTSLLVRAGSPPGTNKYGPWPHGDGLLAACGRNPVFVGR